MRLEYTLELVNLFVGGYMLIKSALKALSVAAITSLFTVSTVHAYALTSMFETKHYGVYEVILEDVENYDGNMKEIISRDIASKKKYQSTAAIFSHNSKGMQGSIKEPMLGIITTERYDTTKKASITFDDNAKNATYAGIYMTYNQLSKMADNKNLSQLVSELVKLPLVLSEVPVSLVSKNFKQEIYYTTQNRSFVIDFEALDSIFYTKDEIYNVRKQKDCKLNLLVIADRTINQIPFFIGSHGAVNDIVCKK